MYHSQRIVSAAVSNHVRESKPSEQFLLVLSRLKDESLVNDLFEQHLHLLFKLQCFIQQYLQHYKRQFVALPLLPGLGSTSLKSCAFRFLFLLGELTIEQALLMSVGHLNKLLQLSILVPSNMSVASVCNLDADEVTIQSIGIVDAELGHAQTIPLLQAEEKTECLLGLSVLTEPLMNGLTQTEGRVLHLPFVVDALWSRRLQLLKEKLVNEESGPQLPSDLANIVLSFEFFSHKTQIIQKNMRYKPFDLNKPTTSFSVSARNP